MNPQCLTALRLLCSALVLTVLTVVTALADEEGTSCGHHHASPHAAVFLGAATLEGHTDFTLGGDLEFRLPVLCNRLGIGPVVDVVFAEHTRTLVAGGLFVHPVGSLRLLAAPGAEFEEGHSVFVFRAGISYGLHAGSLSIAPTLNLDFVEGHTTWVTGVSLGISL